jgi:TDG/mug DNA glycosylase family protein
MRPTRAELEAARGSALPDVLAPGLRVVFSGINPSLYSAAVGHHFARPGNRFWPAVHASGFTRRLFSPSEDRGLLALGYGITNLCPRPTAQADELTREELLAGAADFERKLARLRPRFIAFLGLGAYRCAFNAAKASVGPQRQMMGEARIWLLPNPSGLNAHYQPQALAEEFSRLRLAVESDFCATRRRRSP